MAPPFKVPAGVETELIDAAARQFKRTVPLAAEDLARVGEVLPENAVMLDELQGQMGVEPRHSPDLPTESIAPWRYDPTAEVDSQTRWFDKGANWVRAQARKRVKATAGSTIQDSVYAQDDAEFQYNNAAQENVLSSDRWTWPEGNSQLHDRPEPEGIQPGAKNSWYENEHIPSVAGPLGAGALAASLLASKQANAETPDPNDAKWAKWASLPTEEKRRRALALPPEQMVEFAKAYTEWKSRQTMSREVKPPPPPPPPVAQVQVGPKTHWLYDLPGEISGEHMRGNTGIVPVLERINRVVGAGQKFMRENAMNESIAYDVKNGMSPGSEYVARALGQFMAGAEYLDQMDPARKAQGINDFTDFFKHPAIRAAVEASKLGGGPQMANAALSWASSKLHGRAEDIDVTRPTDQAAFGQQVLEEGPKLPLYMFGGRLFKVADGAGALTKIATEAANAGVANVVATVPNLGPGGYGADEHGNREQATVGGAFVGGAILGGGIHGLGTGVVKAKNFIQQVIGMPQVEMATLMGDVFSRAGDWALLPASDKPVYRPPSVFSEKVPEQYLGDSATIRTPPETPRANGIQPRGTAESAAQAGVASADTAELMKTKMSATPWGSPAPSVVPTAAVLGLDKGGNRVVRMVRWEAGVDSFPSYDLPVKTLSDARKALREVEKHGVPLSTADASALDGPGQMLMRMKGMSKAQRNAFTQRDWDVGMMEAKDDTIASITRDDAPGGPVGHVKQHGVLVISRDGTIHPYRLNDPELRARAYAARNLVEVYMKDGTKLWAYRQPVNSQSNNAFIPLDPEEGIANTVKRVLGPKDISSYFPVEVGSPEMAEILAITPQLQTPPNLLHSNPATSLDALKVETRARVLGDMEAQETIREWLRPAASTREFEAKQRLVNNFAVTHGVTPEVAHALMRDAAQAMGLKPPRAIIPRRAAPEGEGFGVEGRHSTLDQTQADNWQDSMPALIDASRQNAVVEAADGEMGLKNKADFVPPEGEKSVFSKPKVRSQESAVADAQRAVEMQKKLRGLSPAELKLPANKAKAKFAKQLLADAEATLNESLEPSRSVERQTRSPESLAKGIATKKLNAEINRGRAAKTKGPEAPAARDARWEKSNFEDFVAQRAGATQGPTPLLGDARPGERPFDFNSLDPKLQQELVVQQAADYAHAMLQEQAAIPTVNTVAGRPSAMQVAREEGRRKQIPEAVLAALEASKDPSPAYTRPPSPEVRAAMQPAPPPGSPPQFPGGPPSKPPGATSPGAPSSGPTPPQIPPGGISPAEEAIAKYAAQRNSLAAKAARTMTHSSIDVGHRSKLAADVALRLLGARQIGAGLERLAQQSLVRTFGQKRGIEFREALHSAIVSGEEDAISKMANDPQWDLANNPEVRQYAADLRQYIQESQAHLADLGMIATESQEATDELIELYSRRIYLSKFMAPGTVRAMNKRNVAKMAELDRVVEKLGREGTAFVPPEHLKKDADAYRMWREHELDGFMHGPTDKEGVQAPNSGAAQSLKKRLKLLDENPILRWALGESKDVLVTMPKTLSTIARLRAQGTIFADLAAHADGAATAAEAALNDVAILPESNPPPYALRTVDANPSTLDTIQEGTPRIWHQLPKDPSYGRMAGYWVRSDIYEVVKNVPNVGRAVPEIIQAYVRGWKERTILGNAGSWLKSFFGNMQGHMLAGSFNILALDAHGAKAMIDAPFHFKEFAEAPMMGKTEGSRYMQEARELAVVGQGMHQSETQKTMTDMQRLAEHFRKTEGMGFIRRVMAWGDKLNKDSVNWIGAKFDSTDQWNRYAAFLALRRRGVSAIDAAQRVNISFPSFTAIPEWVAVGRKFNPSPAFTVNAQMLEKYALIAKRGTMGMAGESAKAFNLRMGANGAALGVLAFAANEARKAELGMTDGELDFEKKKLSATTQGYRPGLIALYRRQVDGEGKPNTVFLDLSFLAEPLSWLKGNPDSNPGLRAAYNIVTSPISGPMTDDWLATQAGRISESVGVESPALPPFNQRPDKPWQDNAGQALQQTMANGTLPVPGLAGIASSSAARGLTQYEEQQDPRRSVFQSHGKLTAVEAALKAIGIPIVPGVTDEQYQRQLTQTGRAAQRDVKQAINPKTNLHGTPKQEAVDAAKQKRDEVRQDVRNRREEFRNIQRMRLTQ